MKNIFKVHLLTYIVALICILIGYFKFYLCFMLVLLIHEIGHILFAFIFKWHIKKIILLPFGLLLKFEDNLNKPLIEEFIISIMGIIFQLIFICFFYSKEIILSSNIILIFNLLPIYPLDGSKILNIIINKITNYKTSYFLTLILSYITIIIVLSLEIINKRLIFIIALIPLLFNLIDLIIDRKQVFFKFLLERYLYDFKFKKIKTITNINQMKRDYYHFINNIDEKKYLDKYFNSCNEK